MSVRMYKSDSALRLEDEENKEKENKEKEPINLPEKQAASNDNMALGLGGNNVILTPMSMDLKTPIKPYQLQGNTLNLSKDEIQKILGEI